MQVNELGHVVLYVRDLERSRQFYRDLLGWNEIAGIPGQMAMFSSSSRWGRTHSRSRRVIAWGCTTSV
jgi:catechol 2,3-dioxygenase-like lactoylglutathione lyase family enzyme